MPQYPVIAGGTRLTGQLMRDMLPTYIIKPTSETRASTITLANDSDLILPVEANGVYEIFMYLTMSGLAAADIQTAWAVPSGTTGNKRINGPGSTAADGNADNIAMRSGTHGTGVAILYNGVRNGGNQFQSTEFGVITIGATSGNVILQWAQGTSNATGSVMAASSYIKARRVG